MSKSFRFFGLVAMTLAALYAVRNVGLYFDGRQILSITIFSIFIYGTLLFGEFRLAFAYGGVAALMVCNLLTVERFTQSASLDVLVFLMGTFLVIGFLEESQFFERVVSTLVAWAGPRPQRLLITLMVMASISSALVGEVTAILFMSGAMLHLTGKYKLNPVPFIIMLVFASNIGSAMSSVGNPIGVMIALKTNLGFVDFLKWAAPVALVADVLTFAICRWYYAEAFREFAEAVHEEFRVTSRGRRPSLARVKVADGGDPMDATGDESGDRPGFSESFFSEGPSNTIGRLDADATYRLGWIILLALIGLLLTHGLTEHALGRAFGAIQTTTLATIEPDGTETRVLIEGAPSLPLAGGQVIRRYDPRLVGRHLSDGRIIRAMQPGLKEGTMMVAAALIMGSVVLLLLRDRARQLVERRIDWWTLSFFMMLFASVGTLQDTHVTEVIALRVRALGLGQMATTQIVGWTTGWLSAFLDNVLAVATFMPVVHDIRVTAQTPFTSAVYWFMLFGGTFMGNMTVIGSTANIVAVGLLEKRGHGTIGFGRWMKIGFIVSIASMLLATVMLLGMSRFLPVNHRIPMLPVPRDAPP